MIYKVVIHIHAIDKINDLFWFCSLFVSLYPVRDSNPYPWAFNSYVTLCGIYCHLHQLDNRLPYFLPLGFGFGFGVQAIVFIFWWLVKLLRWSAILVRICWVCQETFAFVLLLFSSLINSWAFLISLSSSPKRMSFWYIWCISFFITSICFSSGVIIAVLTWLNLVWSSEQLSNEWCHNQT